MGALDRNPRRLATGESEDSGLAQLIADWDIEAEQPIDFIKASVFEALVDHALGAPGIVVGRSLRRHWSDAATEDGFFSRLDAAWNGLRNYLDQRWFFNLLRHGDEPYPDTLQRVIVDGNLEAVLDEHLWITSRLRSLAGADLAAELRDGLSFKSGMFFLHSLENKDER